ncbi:hypothetical protein Rhsp01_42920 [Rhizobium sp. NBRC 114257]|uniref:Uncharacterized protein n=1 Tax=Rhizobium dioscoreae TaxID=2653122 RepID=A0ABQ0Z9I8_9HYPH|nr:hypothetical protein RsS93_47790 [Rhizobium dioscoreae]GLU83116.1 hypothetical protein Rhsp01_42920 [Rhizobium sp. NBRC 114257]
MIGAAIVLTLAEHGADVALNFQNSAERAKAVVASIEDLSRGGSDRRRDGRGLLHDEIGAAVFHPGLSAGTGTARYHGQSDPAGSTDTEMNPANGDYSEFQRNLIPLGRYGAPSDIAAAVAFLASPVARQVTDVILNADGGLNT